MNKVLMVANNDRTLPTYIIYAYQVDNFKALYDTASLKWAVDLNVCDVSDSLDLIAARKGL